MDNFSITTGHGPFSDSNGVSTQTSISDLNSDYIGNGAERQQRYRYRSYKLRGEYEQPWVKENKLNRNKYSCWIIGVFVLLAFCLCGYINYAVAITAKGGEFCLVMEDNFDKFDDSIWSHEIQVNGFGTGSFDWTTDDKKNVFVDKDGLHIVPTLTTESTSINRDQIFNDHTVNITKAGGDGSCTGTSNLQCSIHSNATTGVIIPPVRSARLTTKGKKSIQYGKVEVTAKLPKGNWLWPAIWMMPEKDNYGPWPASGEIDIMEARGNDVLYEAKGRDVYSSTLHWGPSPKTDAYEMSGADRPVRRTDYSKEFHTYGLEWTEDHIYTYLDGPGYQTLYWKFDKKKTMWQRGFFANRVENSSFLVDPWTKTGRPNTPFDQPFYLILNVAVGSRNGWFPDSKGNKTWIDGSEEAAKEFYQSIDSWIPTWGQGNDRGMTVKSVKMWQAGPCKK